MTCGDFCSDIAENYLDRKVVEGVDDIISCAKAMINEHVKITFDPTLVRGMGYYTGTIFEISIDGYNFSIAGGGRYDKMIGKFCGQDVSACGFSIGFERIITILKDKLETVTPVSEKNLAILIGKNVPLDRKLEIFKRAKALRAEGTTVTIQPMRKNMSSRLRSSKQKASKNLKKFIMINIYTKEQNDEREMLKLLYQTMKALTSPHIPNLLIRRIFELKAFCINGEGPQVFQCVRCQKKDGQMVFSAREGGLVCTDCARNISDGISLDNSTLYTMQYIEISTIEKLYTFTVSREVLEKLSGIMERYCLLYVEKRFKSLEILETLV